MIKFKKYLAFCFSLTFISSSQAVKSTKIKITKPKLNDETTQLIIANYARKSFKKYNKCTIEYHSEIDTDTNQSLSVLKTRFKIPKKIEPLTLPSGTQLFRYKLLSAYNKAKEQKRLRKDGQRLTVDRYTSLRIKPLIDLLIEIEEQSIPTKNKSTAKEMVGITIMQESEYTRIENRWTSQPPPNLYI